MPSQRSILVTGCSDGGLGSALALSLHSLGWRVIASARNLEKLSEIKAVGIESVQLDVMSQDSIVACVRTVGEMTDGQLDALVNNAGGGYDMPFVDLNMDKVRQLFELNTFSLVSMIQAFLPLLRSSKGGGMIVNNTSIASRTPLPFQSAYNGAKAASAVMTESLRVELAPFNVKVVELVTGAVRTKFFDNINDKDKTLPEGSIYSIARETVDKYMDGASNAEKAGDRLDWAKQVAVKLSSKSPPHQIWLGKFAFESRLCTHIPPWWLDGIVESMTGLDEVRKRYNEEEKKDKSV